MTKQQIIEELLEEIRCLSAHNNILCEAMAEIKAAIDDEEYTPKMIAARAYEVTEGCIYELGELKSYKHSRSVQGMINQVKFSNL